MSNLKIDKETDKLLDILAKELKFTKKNIILNALVVFATIYSENKKGNNVLFEKDKIINVFDNFGNLGKSLLTNSDILKILNIDKKEIKNVKFKN